MQFHPGARKRQNNWRQKLDILRIASSTGHRGWGAEFVQNYLAMPFAVLNLKLECVSIPYVRSEEIHHRTLLHKRNKDSNSSKSQTDVNNLVHRIAH